MKRVVIVLSLLLIILPIADSKGVTVEELFNTDSTSTEIGEYSEEQVYFYAGKRLIASKGDKDFDIKYHYVSKLNSITDFKSLPFGQELIDSDERFEFTGKERDESELNYFGARYYDSSIGRFTSVDPIPGELPYGYVMNNPMNYIDPAGKQTESERISDEYGGWFIDDLETGSDTGLGPVINSREWFSGEYEDYDSIHGMSLVYFPELEVSIGPETWDYVDDLHSRSDSLLADGGSIQDVIEYVSKEIFSFPASETRWGSEGSTSDYYSIYNMENAPDLYATLSCGNGLCVEYSYMMQLVLGTYEPLYKEGYQVRTIVTELYRLDSPLAYQTHVITEVMAENSGDNHIIDTGVIVPSGVYWDAKITYDTGESVKAAIRYPELYSETRSSAGVVIK